MVTLNRTAIKPELLVYQQYTTTTNTTDSTMKTCIIGPNVNTVRFNNADEREQGNLGQWYDSTTDKTYVWPNRTNGSLLNEDSCRLFITNAVVPYYPSGSTPDSTNFYIPQNSINLVRSKKCVSSSGFYTHDDLFGSRGLRIGDVVKLTYSSQTFVTSIANMRQQNGGVTITPLQSSPTSGTYTYKTSYNLIDNGISDLTSDTYVTNDKFTIYMAVSDVSAESGTDYPVLTAYTTEAATTTAANVSLTRAVGTDYVTYTDATSDLVFSLKIADATAIATTFSARGESTETAGWKIEYDRDKKGAVTEIILSDNIPAGFMNTATANTTLTGFDIYLLEDELEIDKTVSVQGGSVTQFTTSNVNIMTESGILTAKNKWFSDAQDSDLVNVYSKKYFDSCSFVTSNAYNWGIMYVEYEEYLSTHTSSVNTITRTMDIDSVIDGPLDVINPMKYGVYLALTESQTVGINYIAVANPASLTSWQAALDILSTSTDSYNIVPMTSDFNVFTKVNDFIQAESAAVVGHECTGWFNIGANQVKTIVSEATSTDGLPVYATITSPNGLSSTNYNYIYIPLGNADFIENNVKYGDQITLTNGTTELTYTVGSVDNANALTIVEDGPTTQPNGQYTLIITHELTKNEIVQDIVDRKSAIAGTAASRRLRWIFPGTVYLSNGTKTSSMFAAAAVAGLASGVAFQQGLTCYALSTIADTPESLLLDRDSLTLLSGNGIWVLNTDTNGSVYTLHAVTGGDYNTLLNREESLVRNADNVTKTIRQALNGFVGVSNTVSSNINAITTTISSVLSGLQTTNYSTKLGGQIVDYETPIVTIDELYSDRLNVSVVVGLPTPLNNVYVTLNFETTI